MKDSQNWQQNSKKVNIKKFKWKYLSQNSLEINQTIVRWIDIHPERSHTLKSWRENLGRKIEICTASWVLAQTPNWPHKNSTW